MSFQASETTEYGHHKFGIIILKMLSILDSCISLHAEGQNTYRDGQGTWECGQDACQCSRGIGLYKMHDLTNTSKSKECIWSSTHQHRFLKMHVATPNNVTKNELPILRNNTVWSSQILNHHPQNARLRNRLDWSCGLVRSLHRTSCNHVANHADS